MPLPQPPKVFFEDFLEFGRKMGQIVIIPRFAAPLRYADEVMDISPYALFGVVRFESVIHRYRIFQFRPKTNVRHPKSPNVRPNTNVREGFVFACMFGDFTVRLAL